MVSGLESFNQSFVWENRDVLLPVTAIGIPLAIEIFAFISKVRKDPGCIKRKLIQVKQDIHAAFHQQANESTHDFQKRLVRNIIFVAFSILLIGASIALPYIILPGSMALPIALAAIQASGVLLTKIRAYPNLVNRMKDFFIDSFNQRVGETDADYKARRNKAIKTIIKCTCIFILKVSAICFASYIGVLLSQSPTIWALEKMLPYQTKGVVIAEYLAVGLAHAYLAHKQWKKGNKGEAMLHIASAALSVFFPFWYLSQSEQMRLHHSFTGLALQLVPSKPIKAFGGVIAADSFMYVLGGQRGFEVISNNITKTTRISNYDFMNIVVENTSYVLTALTSLCFLERISHFLTSEAGKKKIVEVPPPKVDLAPLQAEFAKRKKILFDAKKDFIEFDRMLRASRYKKYLRSNKKLLKEKGNALKLARANFQKASLDLNLKNNS